MASGTATVERMGVSAQGGTSLTMVAEACTVASDVGKQRHSGA